eukprot:1148120-Pelagomonas_calceolata.AAC.6
MTLMTLSKAASHCPPALLARQQWELMLSVSDPVDVSHPAIDTIDMQRRRISSPHLLGHGMAAAKACFGLSLRSTWQGDKKQRGNFWQMEGGPKKADAQRITPTWRYEEQHIKVEATETLKPSLQT